MARKVSTEKTKLTKDSLKKALHVFTYIRPYLAYFVVGMICLVFGSLTFMIFPGAAGDMANKAAGQPVKYFDLTLNQFGLLFLVILVIQGVLSYVRTITFAVVSEKGMADLRKDLYNKLLSKHIAFFEERRVGEMTSRLTADVEQLQGALSITLAEFLRQVVILISGVVIIFFFASRLALVMLVTFPVIVLAAMFFGRYIKKLSKKRQDALADTSTIVDETFQSFSVVKSFANEYYESIRYGKSVSEIVKISLSFAKVRGVFFIFIITILFGGIFFVLWTGANHVQQGIIEVGDLFAFIFYTGIIGGAIASFGNLYTSLASAIGATERIQEILVSEGEVKISKDIEALKLQGDIKFKNVHFTYPTRKDIQVLKGIDIDIKQGEKVALVGQSGGGKSTVVQLLMRFYDLDDGAIFIDNKDLTKFDILALRKNIGIVPQEVILFGGTIKENILYGKPDASMAELRAAAEKSNSLEFIESFPEGFDTVVGERGIKLSGGQKQRVAIARAILKDPKILLLDEATSSLDAESEKVVQEALDILMEGRTALIIAHRLSTIRDVDKIYVIDGGKIIESGNHNSLSKKENGAYNNLAKLQFDQS